MALVNQAAAAQSQPSVGFANPALYAIAASSNYATAFHDISSGCNPNGAKTYCAGTGYDLVTGLGSPQCGLINVLAHMPPAPPPPACTATYKCESTYFPPGTAPPVGYHTVEAISVSCRAAPTEIVKYEDGAWQPLGQVVANAGYPSSIVPNEYTLGGQAAGQTTWGAPIGSTQTIRACTTTPSGMTCDPPSTVTIANCCRPVSCEPGTCGTIADGCGGTVNCGGCDAGMTCKANYCQSTCTTAKCKCEKNGGTWNGSSCDDTCSTAKCKCEQGGGTWSGNHCI
jgi:hypothetical protein